MKESKTLSHKKKIKDSASDLAFFEEDAEKVIRACKELAFLKGSSKKGSKKKVVSEPLEVISEKLVESSSEVSSSESLEVISEKLTPEIFPQEVVKKEIPVKFEDPTLDEVKKIYKPSEIYSSKKDNLYKGPSIIPQKKEDVVKSAYMKTSSPSESYSEKVENVPFEEEIKMIPVGEPLTVEPLALKF